MTGHGWRAVRALAARRSKAGRGLASLFLLAALACASRPHAPDFALVYTQAARHHAPDRNPIIVIPGILGSKLRDPATGELAWGAFESGAANPEPAFGSKVLRDGRRVRVDPDGRLGNGP